MAWAQGENRRSALLGMGAAVAACLAVWRKPDAEMLPLVTMLVLALPAAWRAFRRLADAQVLAGIVFLALVAEQDVAFAHMPSPFKALGEIFFTSKVMLNFGLNIKGQEAIYVGLFAWLAFKNGRRDGLALLADPRFRVAALIAAAIPGSAALAVLIGQLKGHDLGLAITQIHFLVLGPFAFYAGYVACRSENDLYTLLRAVVVAMIIKSVLAWYAFHVFLGSNLGSREYLIEHWTSDYLATAMLAVGGTWLIGKKSVANTVATLSLLLLIFWPYMLNDRRTAFVGLIFTVGLLPLVFFHRVRAWHFAVIGAAAAALVLFIGATWDAPPPLGFLSDLIESILFPAPSKLGGIYKYDYRHLENFNLYTGLFQDPILGMGLGTRFPHALPMADIQKNFELWDAVPHNNMLFMWTFCGPVGMAALSTFTVVGTAIGIRLVRSAKTAARALLGVLVFSCVVRWIFWVFGDLGIVEIPFFCLINTVVAMGLKLDQMEETPA